MEHVGQTTVAINAIGEHGRDDVGELRPLAVRRGDKRAVDLVELCGGELVDSSLLVRIGNAIRELGCDVGLETGDLELCDAEMEVRHRLCAQHAPGYDRLCSIVSELGCARTGQLLEQELVNTRLAASESKLRTEARSGIAGLLAMSDRPARRRAGHRDT